jgi:hypothetical protein
MYRPKVGEECIITWVNGVENGIVTVTITYVGDGVACYKSKINNYSGELMEYTCALDSVRFRPLKSKRDEEIDEMFNHAKHDGFTPLKKIVSNLYDAGYRKQLPYSQFVSIIQCYFDQFAEWDDSSSFDEAKALAAQLGYTLGEN